MKNQLYHPLYFGGLELPGNIFAAPMAGYTDKTTRYLTLEGGADIAYTEMVSAEALLRDSRRSEAMLERAPGENILAVQLFGSNPEVLNEAALRAEEMGADVLDLNAGCPVQKVVSKGAGAALGRDPVRLEESVAALADTGLPVSVKFRSGWDESEITWRLIAEAAVRAGARMLGFHPRTRKQGYGGRAEWRYIRELVEMVEVPVIGSGDLTSPEQAQAMLKETRCAGVMFARGAIGDPGIFLRTRNLLTEQESIPYPDRMERLRLARRHLQLAAEAKGKEQAAKEMKKHLAAYMKGWESAAEFRKELMRAPDLPGLLFILDTGIQRFESSR